jgi:NAD(P)-dependent dehydrogenase (short-subunit alcohol dehydrogenase family)
MTADDVIVVTGAAGGMGPACARAFSERGLVLLVDLDEDALASVAEGLAKDARVDAMRCDVTSDNDVARLVERVDAAGRFATLVHTAGISPTMADGPRVLEVDLVGTARVLRALEPLVTPGAVAVCISSIAGYSDQAAELNALLDDPLSPTFINDVISALPTGLDGDTAYVLAKRGVMRLCERLSLTWGARGGRVVSIAPGLIDTAMARREFEQQEIMSLMADITPVKRPGLLPLPGLPEDVASTAAFLASPAAAFISGCDIRVDGGLVGAGRHMGGPL